MPISIGSSSLEKYFHNRINTSYGWGTLLTNDFRDFGDTRLDPLSIVCKIVMANGRPCVKLSDDPGKNTGLIKEVENYKRIFV